MADMAGQSLIDARFGPIRRLVRQPTTPQLPSAFIAYSADVAGTTRIGRWRADPWAFGAAFHDDGSARQAAIGEAVERYCGNAVPPGLRRASYRALVDAGEAALDPTSLVLHSASQYDQRGFPFVPFTADLMVRWVKGRDLHRDTPVLGACLSRLPQLPPRYLRRRAADKLHDPRGDRRRSDPGGSRAVGT